MEHVIDKSLSNFNLRDLNLNLENWPCLTLLYHQNIIEFLNEFNWNASLYKFCIPTSVMTLRMQGLPTCKTEMTHFLTHRWRILVYLLKNPRDSNVPGQSTTLSIVGNNLPMFCLTPKAFSPREPCLCFICMMTCQISSNSDDDLVPLYANQVVLSYLFYKGNEFLKLELTKGDILPRAKYLY